MAVPTESPQQLSMAVAWWLASSVDFMSSTVRMLSHPNSSPQILSNIAIYLCAITVGTMSYYMADRKHRKAFWKRGSPSRSSSTWRSRASSR